jgi:nucleoside-specific outer membrane channel protein Tsx
MELEFRFTIDRITGAQLLVLPIQTVAAADV